MRKVKIQHAVIDRTPVNHYLVFDRSGSMYGYLSNLIDNLVIILPQIPAGDTVSIAWFSGLHQYEWLVKAHIIGASSEQFLKNLLNQYKHTVGMTCFSEVLKDMKNVTEITRLVSRFHSLMFFTDGFPTVGDIKKESNGVIYTLSNLPITQSLFIGYGQYYNKEFMAQMAACCNGSVTSASTIEQVASAYLDFLKVAKPMSKFELPDAFEAFYFTQNGVFPIPLELSQEGNYGLVPFGVENIYTDAPGESSPLEGMYAQALKYMKQYQVDRAMDVVTEIGDVAILNKMADAFTDEEYAAVELMLLNAANYPPFRFIEGEKHNYNPSVTVSVMDILGVLAQGDNYFFPGKSSYKRIGAPTIKKEGYPDFKPLSDRVKMTNLIFNRERANVSIQTTVDGTIETKFGTIPNPLLVKQYRTYTVIKDGKLNMPTMVVDLDKDTVVMLEKMGVPVIGRFGFELDLSAYPLINRTNAWLPPVEEVIALKDLELNLEAQQKVVKWLLPQESFKQSIQFSTEENDYLEEIGVNPITLVYNPPMEVGQVQDEYLALRVQFKKKGFSSLPSLAPIQKKLEANKALTPAEQLVWDYYLSFSFLDEKALTSSLEKIKRELFEARLSLAKVIAAIVIGKKWFAGLSERNGAQVKDYTISLDTVKVEI